MAKTTRPGPYANSLIALYAMIQLIFDHELAVAILIPLTLRYLYVPEHGRDAGARQYQERSSSSFVLCLGAKNNISKIAPRGIFKI